MSIAQPKKLFFAIAICELVGVIGSVFTFSSITTWYGALIKPSFAPPNFIFGPVWLTLYALMGISLYRVWVSKLAKKDRAMKLFGVHLGLNAMWSVIFFGLHSINIAFVDLVAMWVTLVLVMFLFWRIDRLSVYLLVPYLFWITFASLLNFSIWQLNV